MATMPSEPIDTAHELDTLCRWGIRVAWRLSLLWGALVSLLSWTRGAGAETAVIRGLVTFVAFGLLGWGVNAILIQGGKPGEDASAAGEDATGQPQAQPPKQTAGEASDEAAAPGAKRDTGEAQPSIQGEASDAAAGDRWSEPDYLAEAAS